MKRKCFQKFFIYQYLKTKEEYTKIYLVNLNIYIYTKKEHKKFVNHLLAFLY
jgi:hypothetical protein